MWFGRFGMIVPILAIAGSLAAKKRLASTPAPCRRTARCSSRCCIGVVVLVGVLNYVPALALGPVVEHLQLFDQIRHHVQCHAKKDFSPARRRMFVLDCCCRPSPTFRKLTRACSCATR
jgi:hypothetical protein